MQADATHRVRLGIFRREWVYLHLGRMWIFVTREQTVADSDHNIFHLLRDGLPWPWQVLQYYLLPTVKPLQLMLILLSLSRNYYPSLCVIYNKYIPHFWHRAPCNFIKGDRDQGVFCYVNEVAFGTPSKVGSWFSGEPTLWWEGWNFQSHTLSLGRREGLEVESITNGSDFNNHA